MPLPGHFVLPHSPTQPSNKKQASKPQPPPPILVAPYSPTTGQSASQQNSPPGKRRVPPEEKRPVQQPSSKPTTVAHHSITQEEPSLATSLKPRVHHQAHDSLRPRHVEPTQTAKTPPDEPAQAAALESLRSSMELAQTVDKTPNVELAQTKATTHQSPPRGLSIFRRKTSDRQQESAQSEETHDPFSQGFGDHDPFLSQVEPAPTEETHDPSRSFDDFGDDDSFLSPAEPAQTKETHDSRPSRGGIKMFRTLGTQAGTKTMVPPIPTQAGTNAMVPKNGNTNVVVPTQACSNAMVPMHTNSNPKVTMASTREASNAVVSNPILSNMTMQPNNNAMIITVQTQMDTINASLAVAAHAQASDDNVIYAIHAVATHALNSILALATQTTNPNDNAINDILAVTTKAHDTILALTTQAKNVMAQASKGTNDENRIGRMRKKRKRMKSPTTIETLSRLHSVYHGVWLFGRTISVQ